MEVPVLEAMFAEQNYLQEKLGHFFSKMTADEVIEYIRRNQQALGVELVELLNTTPWKYWAKYPEDTVINRSEYLKELVDILHFFLNLALVVGITPGELAEAYFGKRAINENRWATGYDGHWSKANESEDLPRSAI